jgi:hypothetical protein
MLTQMNDEQTEAWLRGASILLEYAKSPMKNYTRTITLKIIRKSEPRGSALDLNIIALF